MVFVGVFFFLAALGLRCYTWALYRCGEWWLLFVMVRRLLIAVASCCGARALGVQPSVVAAHGLSSCSMQALEHAGFSRCGVWTQ